jgi:hypothetical protein
MSPNKSFVLVKDASRNRSGVAKAHLIGVLSNCVPEEHGVREVHVWAFRSLLDRLLNRHWLTKHNPSALERSLIKQLVWEASKLAYEVRLSR